MKVKVSEAKGQVLDWMVAVCDGADRASFEVHRKYDVPLPVYSTDWLQGGPIIEREGLDVVNAKNIGYDQAWMACAPIRFGSRGEYSWGSTPLIAAMRCYVASKLGDEVDVPEVLV